MLLLLWKNWVKSQPSIDDHIFFWKVSVAMIIGLQILFYFSMSKTQKKNHKRKYERQQQRMAEEGVTEEHFQP